MQNSTALHKLLYRLFYDWRIKSGKNFPWNQVAPGLFFKNCSGTRLDWCEGLCISFSCVANFCLLLAIVSSFHLLIYDGFKSFPVNILLIDSLTLFLLTFLSTARNDLLWMLSYGYHFYFISLINLTTLWKTNNLSSFYDEVLWC